MLRYLGSYTPPPCAFNRVTMNFTVTSAGRQFDRLALMYLGDIEVFRTSTAEPTDNGIIWTYVKEMEQYDVLWKLPQKIIFDLGNLMDDTYTGSYNTMLTATFFTVPNTNPTANIILPISAKLSAVNKPSAFSIPSQNASVAYQLPRNIKRAIASLSACGQFTEEFWYNNVFSSQNSTFGSTTGALYGFSPFREVQLLIDGQLAGVSWPFPIIFTGGIAPGFWRPIVGIDAFDLREHEIDITPWLPLLCDGGSHTFEIRVVGLDDDGANHATISQTVGSYWVVTGKIFVFLDLTNTVTTGNPPTVNQSAPTISISSSITSLSDGTNDTLTYSTSVTRDISITSTIKTSQGSQTVSWLQRLAYSNFGKFSSEGAIQSTIQRTEGSDISSSGYRNPYSYPITVNTSFVVTNSSTTSINAALTRGLDFGVYGPSVFPSGIQTFNISSPSSFDSGNHRYPSTTKLSADIIPRFSGAQISTTQTGSAAYLSTPNGTYSYGTTEQDFSFKGAEVGSLDATYELYHRHVKAVNGTVEEDEQSLVGKTITIPAGRLVRHGDRMVAGGTDVKAALGRGPGKPKQGYIGG